MLYKQAKIRGQDKSPDDIEWEKAKNECIFRPNAQRRLSMGKCKKSSSSEINIVENEGAESYLRSILSEKSLRN